MFCDQPKSVNFPPIITYGTLFSVAVILAGPPGTGKTSAINTAASVISAAQRGEGGPIVKVTKVFPGVFEGLSDLYGHVISSGDWVDGVFTDTFRKAHKVRKYDSK